MVKNVTLRMLWPMWEELYISLLYLQRKQII